MSVVVVSGIPKNEKISKFIGFMKTIVFKGKVKDVTVNYSRPVTESLIEIALNLRVNDARRARKFLDGFQYIFAKEEYRLECFYLDYDEEQSFLENVICKKKATRIMAAVNYEPPSKIRRETHSPPRSHSPNRSNELREIELKIELIRKQRMLMEEETKLLLEKRKLEYLQNFGSYSNSNLSKFEEVCRRNDAVEVSEFVGAAKSVIPHQSSATLPSFLGPCREITSQMRKIIRGHSGINRDTRLLLWNLLRGTLKKRLTVCLEGKGYMKCKDIVKLYREAHPKEDDAKLVDELINTIETSCWPTKKKAKKAGPDNIIIEGQKSEAINPVADAQEAGTKYEKGAPIDDSELVDLDEFVDMNDVENWAEDVDDSNVEGKEGKPSVKDTQKNESELKEGVDVPETLDDTENAGDDIQNAGDDIQNAGDDTVNTTLGDATEARLA